MGCHHHPVTAACVLKTSEDSSGQNAGGVLEQLEPHFQADEEKEEEEEEEVPPIPPAMFGDVIRVMIPEGGDEQLRQHLKYVFGIEDFPTVTLKNNKWELLVSEEASYLSDPYQHATWLGIFT